MAHPDLKTGLDILQAALLDAGESSSASGEYADDGKRAVRKAYWAVLAHARWPWAMSPTPNVITTAAAVRASVQSITGTAMTLTANLSPSVALRKVYLESNQSVYRIAAHTTGTAAITLDATYVESEVSGAAVIFQDEYTLPTNVLRIWDPLWPRGWYDNPIPLIDKPMFEQRYGRGAWGFGSSIIEAACEIHPQAFDPTSDNMIRQIRIAPWSEDAVNLEHDYTKFHDLDFSGTDDVDTPRIPREHRSVIADLAASLLLLGKDDSKAKDYAAMGAGRLQSMMDLYLPSQKSGFYVPARHSVALGLQ